MHYNTPRHPLRTFQFWFLVLGCVAATTAWKLGWFPERGSRPAASSTDAAAPASDVAGPTATLGAATSAEPAFAPPPLQRREELLAEMQSEPGGAPGSSAGNVGAAPDRGAPPAIAGLPSAAAPSGGAASVGVAPATAAGPASAAAPSTAAAAAPAAELPPPTRMPQWEATRPAAPAGEATSPLPPTAGSGTIAGGASNPFGRANLEFVPAGAAPPAAAAQPRPETERFPGTPGMIQQVAAVEGDPAARKAVILGGEAPPSFVAVPTVQVDWNLIDRMISGGQDVEAHRMLSTLYWEQGDLRDKLSERINQTAMRIYFQPQPHYLEPYVVQPGDRLEEIAKAYQVSWQYLAKLNRVDPLRIRPGQSLKVTPGPFGAVVDLRRFELTVHSNGYYVARFPIGIGKDGSTPVGEFTVQDKLDNPTYYGPDGVIAADDPRNPLGEFWLAIGDGYGLHGTIDEASIGRAESRGCIRLRNQDIADVYDLLTIGSSVVIRR